MSEHRLPRRGSAVRNALLVLSELGGSGTLAIWYKASGVKVTQQQFSDRIVSQLTFHGLVKAGVGYALTSAGYSLLGEREPNLKVETKCSMALPRTAHPFRPLQCRSATATVYRDGAFDYRNLPSLMGGKRVPYGTPDRQS